MIPEPIKQLGMFALLSMIVALGPMVMGVVYALRPTEARLGLMRPLSLAGLFAGCAGMAAGFVNEFKAIARSSAAWDHTAWLGFSEALTPLFVAFGCLTVAWLCVALGMSRQAD